MATQDTILNQRYRLLGQQGSGGMAVIYKAQDLALGRTVAIKVLRPSLTGDPSFLTRFRQEARNVANLAHPNIVTLYDVGQDGNTYYMVMEYVDGQDLKKLIRAQAPFPVNRALDIGIQICAGIGYAHRAGLVHADIKPQNVLVTADDHVKVTDFGIAHALSVTQPAEKQNVVWGSPHYFAPEQAAGEAPTPASDVYSIGIVIFEMLTGKLPYSGTDQQELALAHIRDAVPHIDDFEPNVPVHLDRIIYKVMAKNPSDRYRTADQLGRILIGLQKQGEDLTAGQAPVSASQPVTKPNLPKASPYGAPPPKPAGASNTPPYPGAPVASGTPAYPAPAVASPQTNPSLPSRTNPNPAPTVASPVQATPYAGPVASYPQVSNPAPVSDMGSTGPEYQTPPAPLPIDPISVALGIIAFILVAGLLPLWIAVMQAWFSR
ncbi:MAG TPA: protein kinase [Aggregatilineales bacterium]|nr:protein kinase [Aggregatilineales bacterium]